MVADLPDADPAALDPERIPHFNGVAGDHSNRPYQASDMGRPHLDGIKSRRLRNISSLAFGGADLRTAYLGCLLGDSLATFRSPVAGTPPVHWNY